MARLPSLAPAERRRGVRRAWAQAGRRAGAGVLPRRARRGRARRHPPLRRRALARLHRRLGLGPARHRAQDAPLVRRARARGVRREPRVHELAVRDQHQALERPRRRRPRLHAQGRGEGDRSPRGSARDLHGEAVRGPGRLRASTSISRSATAPAQNAFADEDGPAGLSRLAASFIAGVLEHAQGLQALLGPTVNAYKRILPDSLAPTHANWGHDNRTAFCRVPLERARARGSRSGRATGPRTRT